MKHFVWLLLFFSAWSAAGAKTYYLSPVGNDSNLGTAKSAPWRSVYHSGLVCGEDHIVALPSEAYDPSQFAYWGQVSCPSSNKVVWVECAVFDTCRMTIPQGSRAVGMWIDQSFWGVQGFEIRSNSTSPDGQTCFNASPPTPSSPPLRNIIFANNVAVNCPAASFGAGVAYMGKVSVDYLAYVGNLSYGAAASNWTCNSGFVIFTPVAADNQPGTHLYVAGNFSEASSNPANANCVDGNGFILDTFDGSTSGEPSPYSARTVVDNNIAFGNGGAGIRVYESSKGSGKFGRIYLRHNTVSGNGTGAYQAGNSICGEMQLFAAKNVTAYQNLAATSQPGCFGVNSQPNAAYIAVSEDASSSMLWNWGYAVPYGSDVRLDDQGTAPVKSFVVGKTNLLGTNPLLAPLSQLPAPSCSGKANVPECMAPVVAKLTPALSAATSYGYQKPSLTPVADPLFPEWLCHVDLPPGLVTMGCAKKLHQSE